MLNRLMCDLYPFAHSVNIVDHDLTMCQALLTMGDTCETNGAPAFMEFIAVGDIDK